ncbi:MAG TPA: hypothetical protein DDY91_20060 [Planctomycetaceae bacterium]|nr:hypothetical protein [Planctomycetaceae bacterium]
MAFAVTLNPEQWSPTCPPSEDLRGIERDAPPNSRIRDSPISPQRSVPSLPIPNLIFPIPAPPHPGPLDAGH